MGAHLRYHFNIPNLMSFSLVRDLALCSWESRLPLVHDSSY